VAITASIPPYRGGGTVIHGGASIAIGSRLPRDPRLMVVVLWRAVARFGVIVEAVDVTSAR
jgi:hypothetical protein